MESFIYRLQGRQRLAAAGIALLLTFNLFVSQGRTGQVVFIVLTVVTLFQYYKERLFKAAAISTTCIIITLFGVYNLSTNFQARVDQTYSNFYGFESKPETSMGQRLTFAINSWELIEDNFIIGVGTGDFKDEYRKINARRSPQFPYTVDPHNHYLYVLSLFGLLGFVVFLAVFYYQFRHWRNTKDRYVRIRLGVIVFYLTIMLAGSYLTHHNTTLLFVLLSSFLFKNPKTLDS